MCKGKNGTKMNNLIGKRLEGIENVQAENFRDTQDVLAIYNAQLNELRTQLRTCYDKIIATSTQAIALKLKAIEEILDGHNTRLSLCYEEVHGLSQDHLKEKLGLFHARLNDFATRLTATDDIVKDLQAFIDDHGGV